jgi:hypothetical protein
MRLRNLDAHFVKLLPPEPDHGHPMHDVETLAEADGVMFECPKCHKHQILCWFNGRSVPDEIASGTRRWNPTGVNIDDLTFVGPGATSVLVTQPCGWHGFVRNGDAT